MFDENEKARAKITAFSPGLGTWLNLCDENGKERITLAVTSDGPWLSLCDENGEARLEGCLAANGDPSLTVYRGIKSDVSEAYKEAMQKLMAAPRDETQRKRCRDASQQRDEARAKAMAIVVGATSNITKATGVVTSRPANSICIYGPDGHVLWQVP